MYSSAPALTYTGWEKPRQPTVKTADFRLKILTQNLLNTHSAAVSFSINKDCPEYEAETMTSKRD
jgi:hypothetical protein